MAIEHTRNILLKKELVEAVKIKNYLGIIFADGATGRWARVSGSGIDAWAQATAE